MTNLCFCDLNEKLKCFLKERLIYLERLPYLYVIIYEDLFRKIIKTHVAVISILYFLCVTWNTVYAFSKKEAFMMMIKYV